MCKAHAADLYRRMLQSSQQLQVLQPSKAERFGCQLMYLCTQERAAASDFILDDGAVHPQKGYSTFVLTSDRCDVGW